MEVLARVLLRFARCMEVLARGVYWIFRIQGLEFGLQGSGIRSKIAVSGSNIKG